MATAPTPLCYPGESTLVKVIHAPDAVQIEELERIAIMPEIEVYSTQIFDNPLTREAVAEAERLDRLATHRMIWGVISALFLIALCVALSKRSRYEPEAALLACSLGLFAVFCMKVGDAKR